MISMKDKINYLIIDDEKNSREVLKKLLNPFCDNFNFLGEATNIDSAFELINTLKPNLIFLDIQMPGGDGFSLLRKFEGEIDFEIIFITSYDQYAINAIKANATDYLLKPIDTFELENSLDKARKKILERMALLQNKSMDKKFTVHYGDKVKIIMGSEISHIEADGRYSNIFTSDGQKYTTPKNLKDIEEFFGSDSELVRINKSLTINISEISEYSKGDPFIIKLNSGNSFEVARRKKAEVLRLLKGNT